MNNLKDKSGCWVFKTQNNPLKRLRSYLNVGGSTTFLCEITLNSKLGVGFFHFKNVKKISYLYLYGQERMGTFYLRKCQIIAR